MRLSPRSKYSAKKTVRRGIKFDSKMEAEYYDQLLLLQRAGHITDLKLQPSFALLEPFEHNGKKVRGVKYKADFMFKERGKTIVIDVKGVKTKDFIIKAKFFMSMYPDYELRLVKKSGSRWIEEIKQETVRIT